MGMKLKTRYCIGDMVKSGPSRKNMAVEEV